MNDSDILARLKILIKDEFQYKLDNDKCIELSLSDKNYIYHGLIRHYTINEKKNILDLIARLESLQKLDLRRNKLLHIESNFFERLNALEYLDLGSNYLQTIPESISQLKQLRYLNIGVNDLETCPSFFSEFENLQTLSLHKNRFSVLDASVGTLKNLRSLNVYGMNFKSVPVFIFDLTNLYNLTLSHFSQVPREIANLQKLEYFTNNIAIKLTSLPDEFTSLKRLKMTRLYQNSLKYLPEEIGNLQELEQLSLYQNHLTYLPKSFEKLQKLEKLNLGWNDFEAFPREVLSLRHLKWFGYFKNSTEIPDLSFIDTVVTDRINEVE
ncbi:MAG: hypothetical protein PHX59_07775 [Sulfuricurvum sp.]|nr:hypothetical protein [Sulfuricurvum sp.]